ncbi:cation:proton antiporter [Krasilnikovia cinnamomea]|uniref:cation:proton antiporter n=1 Tax=Krasilnikovia cinnamomea TaxID=349313 RepID=UPI001F5F1080|nr:cation:proton antiporter [Krasilnikovia cinnamomea]
MSSLADVVAPLPSGELLLFLLQVALLLALALLLGALAARLRLPRVVGELLAGVLAGPSVLGHLAPAVSAWLLPRHPEQVHLLDAVAQLGVLLLVGLTGMELDRQLIRRRGGAAARVSVAGLLIPLALGVGTGYLLPTAYLGGTDRTVFALFLGVAMCVSAIPVIAKTLTDLNLQHRDVGQLALIAAAVDDTVGWFLLSVVAAMATTGISPGLVALSVLSVAGFAAAAAVVGQPAVRCVMRLAARSPGPGPSVATAVVVVLLAGAASHALGMEPVLGAFVAGLLVLRAGMADPARLAPLRVVVHSVLAPLFLVMAGFRMDLTALARPGVLLMAAVVIAVAIVGKFAGAYLGARTSRLGHWEGVALGAAMNSRGVVEVVVAMTGLRLGVLNTTTYTVVVLVALVTSVMAGPMLRWSMARVREGAEERLRRAVHDAWRGPVVRAAEPGRPPAPEVAG